MFSQLGPLFKTQFRQTESNDTRQHIPHEERDQHRKKGGDEERKTTSDEVWTDDTSVSVIALKAFLIDFLKTLPGGEDYQGTSQSKNKEPVSPRPREKSRPTNTHNAKAVRAYQTMAAHAQEDSSGSFSEKKEPKNNNPTADKLESKELRDIYALITDLEILEKRGVGTLHIHKAESFVESLKQAVQLEKSKF